MMGLEIVVDILPGLVLRQQMEADLLVLAKAPGGSQ